MLQPENAGETAEGETEIDINLLKPKERLDDLRINDLKIIQDPEKFCFGIDAVLLSDFAKVKPGETVVDIGTGTGIIPILLTAKTEGKHFYGYELQSEMAEMASRSVAYNHLEEKVTIINDDINNSSTLIKNQSMDVITCNPPYMNDEHGLINEAESIAISRHELKCTLADVIREGARMLRTGGRYYMIHRPYRLEDVLCTMREYRLEPKRLKMIHPYIDKEANLFLIEARKDSGSFMVVEPPMAVYKR